MARSKESAGRKVIFRNKKAFHDYFIEDRVEAGLVLLGTEVKSLREGRVSLNDAYATIEDGEAYILNMHISEWPGATHFNHEPDRRRKLLLRAQQIHQRGYTLVALSIYFNEKNRAKIELGLARGKRQYDKRQTIREREEKREADRERRR